MSRDKCDNKNTHELLQLLEKPMTHENINAIKFIEKNYFLCNKEIKEIKCIAKICSKNFYTTQNAINGEKILAMIVLFCNMLAK